MSNYTHFNLSYDDAGVAWLSMDAAGRSVNVLAQEVMAELIAASRSPSARRTASCFLRRRSGASFSAPT